MDMNEQEQKEFEEKLLYFFQGNTHAVELCVCLSFIVHVWDDLIDQDKEISHEEINTAFWTLFSTIPRNPFYIEAQGAILPLIERVILAWHDANVLEQGTEHERHLAFGLRSMLIQVYHHIAFLIGGYRWIRKVGPEIQRIHQYELDEFLEEMRELHGTWDAESQKQSEK